MAEITTVKSQQEELQFTAALHSFTSGPLFAVGTDEMQLQYCFDRDQIKISKNKTMIFNNFIRTGLIESIKRSLLGPLILM